MPALLDASCMEAPAGDRSSARARGVLPGNEASKGESDLALESPRHPTEASKGRQQLNKPFVLHGCRFGTSSPCYAVRMHVSVALQTHLLLVRLHMPCKHHGCIVAGPSTSPCVGASFCRVPACCYRCPCRICCVPHAWSLWQKLAGLVFSNSS